MKPAPFPFIRRTDCLSVGSSFLSLSSDCVAAASARRQRFQCRKRCRSVRPASGPSVRPHETDTWQRNCYDVGMKEEGGGLPCLAVLQSFGVNLRIMIRSALRHFGPE